jgi:hypothetical protein
MTRVRAIDSSGFFAPTRRVGMAETATTCVLARPATAVLLAVFEGQKAIRQQAADKDPIRRLLYSLSRYCIESLTSLLFPG